MRRAGEEALPGFRSPDEAREVLGATFEAVNDDERIGTLLRATRLRIRYELSDLDLVVNVATADDPHTNIRWAFTDEVDWTPKLRLAMDSATANAYLQGRASLPIAIARGRVRCSGDTRTTLLYLPANRLVVEPYRRLVRARYPHLALA
jgi:hypothetical protein